MVGALARAVNGWRGAVAGLLGPQDYTARTAYRPPSRAYAWLNRHLGVRLARRGWTPGGVASLEVPGRSSGRLRCTPVVVTRHLGRDHLVAIAGEAHWVRNVRANGGRAVLRRGRALPVVLRELPVGQRPPVIAAYLDQAERRGGAASARRQAEHYFGLGLHATPEDIAGVADRYPVFRVETG